MRTGHGPCTDLPLVYRDGNIPDSMSAIQGPCAHDDAGCTRWTTSFDMAQLIATGFSIRRAQAHSSAWLQDSTWYALC